MTAPDRPQTSFPTPHSCRHCAKFGIHLPDVSDEAQAGVKGIAHPPNPSQKRLAVQLFGSDFWTEEWTEYRDYFLQRTAGISFFDATKGDLERFAGDGCLLSQRFVASLGDELPQRHALGAKVIKSTHWSIELCMVDLDNLRWEVLLAEEDEEPDNTYSLLAQEGKLLTFKLKTRLELT